MHSGPFILETRLKTKNLTIQIPKFNLYKIISAVKSRAVDLDTLAAQPKSTQK